MNTSSTSRGTNEPPAPAVIFRAKMMPIHQMNTPSQPKGQTCAHPRPMISPHEQLTAGYVLTKLVHTSNALPSVFRFPFFVFVPIWARWREISSIKFQQKRRVNILRTNSSRQVRRQTTPSEEKSASFTSQRYGFLSGG